MNSSQLAKPLLVAAAAFALFAAAGVPLGYLGFLLLILACPAMMFLMMRGMDHTTRPDEHSADRPNQHH